MLERGLLLRLRFELDLYVNLRPFTACPGRSPPGADFVVDPGEHRGHLRRRGRVPAQGHAARGRDPGLGQHPDRRRALRPVRLRAGRAPAAASPDAVHKTNVLTFSGDLWQRTFDEVAAEYPDVAHDYNHVDAACIYCVEHAARYDVIVTDNLFGDILTDLAGAVAGGIGLAASANLNPARTGPSLFEPVHGAAHDIAGTGRANPLAAIRSAGDDARVPRRADAADRDHQGRRSTAAPTDWPTVDASAGRPPPRSATPSQKGSEPCPSPRPRRSGWTASSSTGTTPRSTSSPTPCTTASGVFEGIRAYATAARRRRCSGCATTSSGCSHSAKIFLIDIPFTRGARSSRRPATTVRVNGLPTAATSARSSTSATARWASTRCRARSTCRSPCGRGAPTSATRASPTASG